LQRLYVLPLHG